MIATLLIGAYALLLLTILLSRGVVPCIKIILFSIALGFLVGVIATLGFGLEEDLQRGYVMILTGDLVLFVGLLTSSPPVR